MRKSLMLGTALCAMLLTSGCSGSNFTHWSLPTFVPGPHMAPGSYVNQDCVINGPLQYGWTAQGKANDCFVQTVKEATGLAK